MEPSALILEILEQNAKWWEKAAEHCETLVQHATEKNQQELTFMCAVYKERADLHARLAQQVRNGETPEALIPSVSGNGNGQSVG
jgi:hypothetical protein